RKLLLARLLVLVLKLAQMRFPVGQALVAPCELGQLAVGLLLLRQDPLLDLDDAGPVFGDFLVDLRSQLNRLFAGADLRLAPEGVRLAAGVLDQQLPLLRGGAEARLAEHADCDRDPDPSEDEADQYPDGDQHGQLLGRLSAALPRCLPGGRPARDVPNRVKRADSAARAAGRYVAAVRNLSLSCWSLADTDFGITIAIRK